MKLFRSAITPSTGLPQVSLPPSGDGADQGISTGFVLHTAQEAPSKTMRPQVGQLINNKYRLVRLVGDGGPSWSRSTPPAVPS